LYVVQEAGWVPGPVWTSAENLAPTEYATGPAEVANILFVTDIFSVPLNKAQTPSHLKTVGRHSCQE